MIITESERKELLNGLRRHKEECHYYYGKYKPVHADLAIMFAEACCFLAEEVQYFDNGVTFQFKKGKDLMTVGCDDGAYVLSGTTTKNGMECEWNSKSSYNESSLYKLMNHVKLFMMDEPEDCVLFSGAFCPPHKGHKSLIEKSLMAGYDCAVVAISNENFVRNKMKKAGEVFYPYCSEQARIDMVLHMTCMIPNVLVHGVENGYTYEVLKEVKNTYGFKKLSFTCGSDKLDEINRWGYHDRLLAEFGFYILQRDNMDMEEIERKCHMLFRKYRIEMQDADTTGISSTRIRNMRNAGEDYRSLMPEKVYQVFKEISE